MAIITLPGGTSVAWKASSWRLLRADGVNQYMNGARQVTAFDFALWGGKITLPPLDGEARRQWRAALVQLSSLGNTFEMGPPDAIHGISTGYAGPGPVVAGANQLGRSLNVDGLTPGAAILNAGEYFHVVAAGVKELKMLTADVVSDGGGAATLSFEPALRNAPADGSAVEIFAPVTGFAISSPEAAWGNLFNEISEFSFEAIEAFGP